MIFFENMVIEAFLACLFNVHYLIFNQQRCSSVLEQVGQVAIGGDDRGCSSIFVFIPTDSVVMQRFDSVLLHDGFIDDARTGLSNLPWLSRQTSPTSRGVTGNSGDPCTNIQIEPSLLS